MIKSVILALALLLGLALHPAHANPLISGQPSAVNEIANSEPSIPYIGEIIAFEKQLHEIMTSQIDAIKVGTSPIALWLLLLGSFAYGIFHVLAPGHGKVIVSSYFLGHHARWRDGVIAGMIMAIGHTITAIGLVVAMQMLFGLTQFSVLDKTRYAELLGYGLIMGIGLWLLYNAIRQKKSCCGHDHDQHHHHDHHHDKQGFIGLCAATSLVPCTGSIIILLFTSAQDILWAGVLAVIAIALGMWLTITIIGTVSIMLRRMVLPESDKVSRNKKLVMRLVSILAALVVFGTGGLLFTGTLLGLINS